MKAKKEKTLFIDTTEKKPWKAVKPVIKKDHFDPLKFKCWMTGDGEKRVTQ